jgi:hypothetical protein
MLDVDIDMKQLLDFNDLTKKVERELGRELKKINKSAEKQAMTQHRYQRRTGKLQYATRGVVKDFVSTLMIDGRIAPYGRYVHEGQRSWAPDRFLVRAGNIMAEDVTQAVLRVLNKVLSGRK